MWQNILELYALQLSHFVYDGCGSMPPHTQCPPPPLSKTRERERENESKLITDAKTKIEFHEYKLHAANRKTTTSIGQF
jgi:hypothetical protein